MPRNPPDLVSRSEACDNVISSLSNLGTIAVHRVRIRAGRQFTATRLPDLKAVAFAIAGKPIGAHRISTLAMRPFFTGDADDLPTIEAELTTGLKLGAPEFGDAVPVTHEQGGLTVPLGHTTSDLPIYEETFDPNVLSSATRASRGDGFVVTKDTLEAGETREIVPYPVVE